MEYFLLKILIETYFEDEDFVLVNLKSGESMKGKLSLIEIVGNNVRWPVCRLIRTDLKKHHEDEVVVTLLQPSQIIAITKWND